MSDVDAYQVAMAAVLLLDPEEAVDLPEIWASWQRQPVTPDGLAERDGLLGSGLGAAFAEWAPLVVAFLGTEVFAGAAVDSVKDGIRRGTHKAWRRLRKTPRDRISFAKDQIAAIREHAEAAALAAGRNSEDAGKFADAFVATLNRQVDD